MANSKSIGVIGLGIIGSRIAGVLRQKGHSVSVWNRSPKNVPNFLGSASEVAVRCPILQFFVSDDEALLQAIQSVSSVLTPRHVLLFHSTVSLQTMQRAAGMVASLGARCLDAPFTGSKNAAANGQLVYYVGGEPDLIKEMEPVLLASGKAVVALGAAGQATVMKLVANQIIAGSLQVLKEGLALTAAAGISPERFREALQLNAVNSTLFDMKLPALLSGDFEPHFALRHMLKDLRHVETLAKKWDVKTPAADAARQSIVASMENGDAERDFSIMAAPPKKSAEPVKSPLPTVIPSEPEKSASAKSEVVPSKPPAAAAQTPLPPAEPEGSPAKKP